MALFLTQVTLGRGDDAVSHFETRVRPILMERCGKCHTGTGQSGGLRMERRSQLLEGGDGGPVIVPGKPEESRLWNRVATGEMPPGREQKLSPAEVSAFRRWISEGAVFPEPSREKTHRGTAGLHWAYRRPDKDAALAVLPKEVRELVEEHAALAGAAPLQPDAEGWKGALVAWYRAEDLEFEDRHPVSAWPDRSGNERHLTATLGAHPNGLGRPATLVYRSAIHGRRGVRFDVGTGLGSRGANPIPIHGDAAFTLGLVCALTPRHGGSGHDLLLSFGEFAAPNNPGRALAAALGLQRVPGADHRLAVVGGWGHDAVLPPGSCMPLYGRPLILTVVKPAGPQSTARIFINGEPSGQLAGVGEIGGEHSIPDLRERYAGDFSVMMGNAVAGAGGFEGDVAEVVVYSRDLETESRRSIEAGLAQRYGITSPAAWFRAPEQAASLPTASKPIPTEPLHPIDAFLDDALVRAGLAAAPRADPSTLIRRASFDLLGLPPAPERVEQFARDDSPGGWERLLAELLASPQYGERWGRHWLDVARYADSGGYETDMYYRHAWRYRDYVVQSFNDDKPFDCFVQEQIAGDELWPNDLELEGSYEMPVEKKRALQAHIATGLYALGPQIHESSMDGKKHRHEQLTDWADLTGSAFLGVTLGCARCHDHKFDPFTQRDYYALQAVFARSREAERPIVNAMEIADFKQLYPRVLAVTAAREAFRRFEQELAGRTATAEEETRRRELLERIARRVLELPERANSTPGTPFDGLFEVPAATVLTHARPELQRPLHLLHRGELDRPRDVVAPGLPVALAQATGTDPALPDGPTSRRDLALWLTRPDHPLTPRVIVNRVWQWHFGRGLVATPSDLGAIGQPPTHPELLDWLTVEFVEHGWSLKWLHRLIMTSAAYRRDSRFSAPENLARDPDNRLLWRHPRRRLEGEGVWDAIHAAAGSLNLKLGGPPVMPPLAAEELANLRDVHRWIVSADPTEHTRRGLYIIRYRNFRFPLFEVFDAPADAVSAPGRDVSTVAPQALWLLNNPAVWRAALRLAERVVREAGDEPSSGIRRLWQLTLGRFPTDAELSEALTLLERLESADDGPPLPTAASGGRELPAPRGAALAKLCLALFSHNEFLFID